MIINAKKLSAYLKEKCTLTKEFVHSFRIIVHFRNPITKIFEGTKQSLKYTGNHTTTNCLPLKNLLSLVKILFELV